MSIFIFVLNALELMACVVGFLYWSKIKSTHWRWFPFYLGIIFVTEMVGEYFLHIEKDLPTNIAIYSYFGIPLQFFFFYRVFYQQFRDTKNSKWPLVSAVIYLVSLVADLFYISKINFFFESFSYIIGCLFLLILLLLYFKQFMRSDEIINYRSSMMFWVSVGIMLFYVGSMPFFAFRTKLYIDHNAFFYVYWYSQFVLNYFMYLLFIVSFVWGKPK